MTLLITVFASCVSTIVWYFTSSKNDIKLGTLSLIYWGASVMWLVDAVFEYVEQKEAFFAPSVYDMVNDAFLGLCAVALGLVIWIAILLIKDPKGVIKKRLLNKKSD